MKTKNVIWIAGLFLSLLVIVSANINYGNPSLESPERVVSAQTHIARVWLPLVLRSSTLSPTPTSTLTTTPPPTVTPTPTYAPTATSTPTATPTNATYSLRFYGTGSGDIDRVKIPISEHHRHLAPRQHWGNRLYPGILAAFCPRRERQRPLPGR